MKATKTRKLQRNLSKLKGRGPLMLITCRTTSRYGLMYYNINDKRIGSNISVYGEWFQSELDFLQPYIPAGGVCIDVGANIGAHTLFFANIVGPSGTVFAIEPQWLAFTYLCGSVAINNHLNIFAYHAAAGDIEGVSKMPFDNPLNEKIRALTIDSLDIPRADLIKFEVKELALTILKGCKKTIERTLPLIYAEYDLETMGSFIKNMKDLEYDVYEHPAVSFNPRNFKGIPKNYQLSPDRKNLFCVPKNKKLSLDLNKF